MRARLALIAAASLSLGACLGGGSAPSELLTLTPAEVLQPGAARTADRESVTVLAPSVPQAGNTNRIPVYVSPTVVQYLQNATFVDEPRQLFRQLLGETIAARTGRLVLNPDVYSQVPGATLTGQLLQFGLDPTRGEVVVAFEAALSRGPQDVRTRRFESRVSVAQQVTAAVAPALNQASNQVAAEVADWIGQ